MQDNKGAAQNEKGAFLFFDHMIDPGQHAEQEGNIADEHDLAMGLEKDGGAWKHERKHETDRTGKSVLFQKDIGADAAKSHKKDGICAQYRYKIDLRKQAAEYDVGAQRSIIAQGIKICSAKKLRNEIGSKRVAGDHGVAQGLSDHDMLAVPVDRIAEKDRMSDEYEQGRPYEQEKENSGFSEHRHQITSLRVSYQIEQKFCRKE